MNLSLTNVFERFRAPKAAVCAALARALGDELPDAIRRRDVGALDRAGLVARDIKKVLALDPDRLERGAALAGARVPARLLSRAADAGVTADSVRADPFGSLKAVGATWAEADAVAARLGMDAPAREAARLAWLFDDIAARGGHTMLRERELAERLRFELSLPAADCLARVRDCPALAVVRGGGLGADSRGGLGADSWLATRAGLATDERLAAEVSRRAAAGATNARLAALAESAEPQALGLDEAQTAALRSALGSGLSVITGGPGTGKSRVVAALVALVDASGLSARVTAPTGKAARNLAGRTVHYHAHRRRVGARAGEDDVPPDLDLMVVDEASMLTSELLDSIFDITPRGAHVLLVGDVEQLPPVGAGDVLRDLIETGSCCVTRLTHNHRSSGGVCALAARVLAGESVSEGDEPGVTRTPAAGLDAAIEACVEAAAARGAQVLAPQNAHRIAINAKVQARLLPAGARPCETSDRGAFAGVGDRVIVTKNSESARNGDLGVVVGATAKSATVRLDAGGTAGLPGYQVALAYATTVHKFQGSETDSVCVPALAGFGWDRALLYTAVTRARSQVELVGSAPPPRARPPRNTVLRALLTV